MNAYHLNLGIKDYKQTWDLQKQIHLYKQKNPYDDVIITVEHPPVYTLGKTGSTNHVLLSENQMAKQGISYYEIDRGGDITYHGPGQLVVYPIFDLNNHYNDTHRYLRDLEETVIRTLKDYGITSRRDEEFTGVWVGSEKICAIGIKVSRWITMHGLAFNINNDLSYFDKIIPCGIFHKGITSLAAILNKETSITDVSKKILTKFKEVFGFDQITPISAKDLPFNLEKVV
jgi:lipoyl(octanoyl) transferase